MVCVHILDGLFEIPDNKTKLAVEVFGVFAFGDEVDWGFFLGPLVLSSDRMELD